MRCKRKNECLEKKRTGLESTALSDPICKGPLWVQVLIPVNQEPHLIPPVDFQKTRVWLLLGWNENLHLFRIRSDTSGLKALHAYLRVKCTRRLTEYSIICLYCFFCCCYKKRHLYDDQTTWDLNYSRSFRMIPPMIPEHKRVYFLNVRARSAWGGCSGVGVMERTSAEGVVC